MIGLIFGETDFPKYILKKIKKNQKYIIIDLTKKKFTTLIDVRIIHSKEHGGLSEEILHYNYNITNKIDIPFYRGVRRYGTISVISIEKMQ